MEYEERCIRPNPACDWVTSGFNDFVLHLLYRVSLTVLHTFDLESPHTRYGVCITHMTLTCLILSFCLEEEYDSKLHIFPNQRLEFVGV